MFSITDITQPMATESALRTANARLAGVIDSALDAIVTTNDRYEIVMFNPAASRVFGYDAEEVLGKPLDVLVPEQSRKVHRQLVREFGLSGESRRPKDSHFRVVAGLRKDGSEFPMEATISKLLDAGGQTLFTAILRDVTRRLEAEAESGRLERQLEHSRKMEAVGQLAGGVAHDFNNLLTATINNVFLLRRATDDPQMIEYLDQIDYASNRAAALTRQLLTFSRRDVSRPELLDLVEVVRSLEPLLTRVVPESIKLTTTLPDTPMTIEADRSQIEQVVMNLVVNATDAMPDGGELDVVITPATPDDSPRGSSITGLVSLSVIDSGHGMDLGVKERMFEPFFTTKPVGKGTGLGLATVFGAVERAAGRIEVDTSPQKGTTITVVFPLRPPGEVSEPAGPPMFAPTGAGSILLCEDEEPVRVAIANLLEHHGYEVHAFATPGEAIARVRQFTGQPVDLVITDVIMPGMSGPALRDVIREAWPDVPVLFVTGYASMPDGVGPEHTIPKPFNPGHLLARVQEELAAAGRVSPNEPAVADDQVIGSTDRPPDGTHSPDA